MKRFNVVLLLLTASLIFPFTGKSEEVKPVKNVIVMIPDGTTIGVYSAARWFKHYNNLGKGLNIDPYIKGTVTTFSSDNPIGDSAPTGSTYATGVIQQSGNIAIHPKSTENDLFKTDPSRTYQPAATILEASKILQNKAVGLVVTSMFPHATPADFSAHYYSRYRFDAIAPQMAYQNLNVMFGGGTEYITDDILQHLNNNGTTLIQDDRNAFLDYSDDGNVWALFGKGIMPYNIDRSPSKVPSLAEMTEKALELLSQKEEGFFLMVEGSLVDWAAHANDAATTIDEYLAFDEAVGKVMEFAKEDGNTAVLVLSDHGTSGFTIGSRNCSGNKSISDLYKVVSNVKISANRLETILKETKPEDIKSEFKKYTGIDITEEEHESLKSSKDYSETDYTKVGTSMNLAHNIVNILNSRMCFGYTSGSHTGEEVIMAAYHPNGNAPKGHIYNTEVNKYLQQVSGLDISLQELSDKIFVKHNDVFKGMSFSIDKSDPKFPILKVKKGRKNLEVKAYSSVAKLNNKNFDIGSVVVYIDKNDTFYLPQSLRDSLK